MNVARDGLLDRWWHALVMPRMPAMAGEASVAGIEKNVLAEQVRLLYAHLPLALVGNLGASLIVATLLWQHVAHGQLIAWLSFGLGLGLARGLLHWRYTRSGAAAAAERYAWGFTLGSTLAGALWGFVGYAFLSSEPVVFLTLVIALAGIVSASVGSHAVFYPAFASFAIPAIAPFVVRCFAEGGVFFQGIGAVSFIFLAVNLVYGRHNQRTILEALRLRFENAALIDELRRQKEIAERASTAKSKFLAAIGHDLRQPVHALELLIDALAVDVDAPRPADMSRLIPSLRGACQGLGDLLDALLEFSRVEAGTIQPQVSDFPIAQAMEQIAVELAPLAAARGLRLHVMPSRQWVRSDPMLIERILRNLVTNAINHTRRGGVVVGCRRGAMPRLEVWDSGSGIPPEQQQEIFREFYQLDNPERDRRKGLGLGLAIVEGLAKRLGHPLYLRSIVGRGSLFALALPAGVPGAPVEAVAAVPDGDVLADKRVLVIDDDPGVCEALAVLLSRWHCDVVTAESAAAALACIGDHWRPQAILVDYRLREGETGLQALVALQAVCGNDLPAAIITGETGPERQREIRAAGYPVLHKPVSGMRLRAVLSSLLASH